YGCVDLRDARSFPPPRSPDLAVVLEAVCALAVAANALLAIVLPARYFPALVADTRILEYTSIVGARLPFASFDLLADHALTVVASLDLSLLFNAPLLRLPALRLRRLRALDLVTYVGLLPTLGLRWPFDPAVVAPAVVDIVASLRAS